MNTTKNSIKIDARGKGLNHYEDYLILKHKREIDRFLSPKEIKPSTKRKIWNLYEETVKRDNIIQFYTHPVNLFLMHMINGTLDELIQFTSCTNIPITKE